MSDLDNPEALDHLGDHNENPPISTPLDMTEQPETDRIPTMKELISKHYDRYLEHLRDLVKTPSVFTQPENVRELMDHCREVLRSNLPDYKISFDRKNNLIAIPNELDPNEDILYLSAHADTVDADISEWKAPFHPFKVHEDENEIVARGVNDCKAGVAFELFLTFLAKEGIIQLRNTIFTITFKEEGPGEKTATEIGKNLGESLPLSTKSTYLLVLENNVRVKDPPVLCIYAAERSSYAIKIKGTILELRDNLERLEHWNPVAILPEDTQIKNSDWKVKKQQGGHVGSVEREANLLTEVLLSSDDNTVVKAGDIGNFSVVPSKISVAAADEDEPIQHTLILSNRSFDTLEDVREQLEGVEYKEVKDFEISRGFNEEERLREDRICPILTGAADDAINIEFTFNVGGSDASMILGSMDKEKRGLLMPIVMGPGSRSQRSIDPPRLTHGVNETFDKAGGFQAVRYISQVLADMGFVEMGE